MRKRRHTKLIHEGQYVAEVEAELMEETFGFMLAFEVAGGLAEAIRVYDRFRVIARAVSLGGVDTLASIPLHTSHAMMPSEERRRADIADGRVRLSVGIELYEVLEADLAAR